MKQIDTEIINEINKLCEKENIEINENAIKELYEFSNKYSLNKNTQHQLISLMFKDEIESRVNKILDRVKISSNIIKRQIERMFLTFEMNIIFKMHILNKALNENNLKPLEDRIFDKMEDLFEEDLLSIPGAKIILEELFELPIKKKGQGSTGVGNGELLIAFFGKGSLDYNRTNGDVFLLDNSLNKTEKIIEVKSGNSSIIPILNEFTIVDFSTLPNYLTKEIRLDELLGIPIRSKVKTSRLKKVLGDNITKVKKNIPKLANKANIEKEKAKNIIIRQFMYVLWYNNAKENTKNEILESINEYKGTDIQELIDIIINKIGYKLFNEYKEKEKFDYLIYFGKHKNAIISKKLPSFLTFKQIGFYGNGGRPVELTIAERIIKKDKRKKNDNKRKTK